jgi:hypothetical protein
VTFNEDLRPGVLCGDITMSVRLWSRPKVKVGGRYPVEGSFFEVDEMNLVPFGSLTSADVARCGEPDRESLRRRAAHAGPIEDSTMVYVVEFHLV